MPTTISYPARRQSSSAASWARTYRLPRKPPLYVVAMAFLTLAYLSVEAPFASLVVETIGGAATQQDLDALEVAGRVISGCAVAVAAVGWWLARCHQRDSTARKTVFGFVIIAALAVLATYRFEGWLVDSIAERSSVQFRQATVRALMARDLMIVGKPYAGAPAAAPRDPAWRAYIGLSGFLGSFDPAALDRAGAGRDAAIRDKASEMFPPIERHRSAVLGPTYDAMQGAWRSYRSNVEQFRRALAYGHEDVAVSSWNSGVEAQFGRGARLRRDIMSFEDFVAESPVQIRVHQLMGVPNNGIRIQLRQASDLGQPMFEYATKVYGPARAAFADRFASAVLGNPEPFANDFRAVGVDSVKLVIVPVMALGFSLLGLIVHIVKAFHYSTLGIMYVATPVLVREPWIDAVRLVVIGGLALGLGIGLSNPATSVTGSPVFQAGTQNLASVHTPKAAAAVQWVVDTQRASFPVGRIIGAYGPFRQVAPILLPKGDVLNRALAHFTVSM